MFIQNGVLKNRLILYLLQRKGLKNGYLEKRTQWLPGQKKVPHIWRPDYDRDNGYPDNITHWMSLPEYPKD